jgi:hypothetical protein
MKVHPALTGAVIVLCVAALFGMLWPIHQVLGQISGLIIIVLGFRYWPPMGRWFLRMPLSHRAVFALMVAGIMAGHFTFDSRRYFPFVAWEIFPMVREDDPVTCREFMATTAGGKSVRLLVEQLFPSIIQFNPPADNDSSAMSDLVGALAKAYDRQHADDPVRRVDLVQIAVRLHPAAGESASPPCELLKSYDVSSSRSN